MKNYFIHEGILNILKGLSCVYYKDPVIFVLKYTCALYYIY